MREAWVIPGLGWVPAWMIGVAVLVAVAIVAASVHGLVLRLVFRVLPERLVFTRMLLDRTRGPSRLALMIFAVSVALPLVPLDDPTTAYVAHGLSLAFIALVGWMALAALDLATTLYLRRFRTDIADNLLARKHVTQTRILKRVAALLVVLVTVSVGLMTFEPVRQYGVSLLAAGGAAGLIVGLAAQPVLSNLFAGLQLAITQPIRIDDAVIVEGEWGTIEEITATYVVVKIWDWRRLIVPLKYFIEHPFQNWTRETAQLIGVVILHADYSVPVERLRARLTEIAKASPLWDGKVVNLQVVDALESTVQLRALVSARDAPTAWDLRCEVREKLIAFLRQEHPGALPRQRAEVAVAGEPAPAPPAARIDRAA